MKTTLYPLKKVFLTAAVVLFLFGLFLLIEYTQSFIYFLSPDGNVGSSAKSLLRIIGIVSLLSGFFCLLAGLKVRVSLAGLIRKVAGLIMGPSLKSWVVFVFLLALLLRFSWILFLPAQPVSDFADYDRIGWDIAQGVNILSPELTAARPPGYPIFLSGFYKVFGHKLLPVKVANAVMGSLLCIIMFYLILDMSSGIVARLSSLIVAVFPTFIFTTSLLATENLSTPLFFLSVLVFVKAYKNGSYSYMALSGLLLGITCLVRTNYSAYPLVFLLWLLLHKKFPFRKRIGQSIIYSLLFFLAISPWLWRNYHIYGKWGIMGTNMGLAVYHSNTPDWGEGSKLIARMHRENPNEYEVDQEVLKMAMEEIRRNPDFYFKNFFRSRYQRLFLNSPEWLSQYNLKDINWGVKFKNIIYHLILISSTASYYLILILCIFGIIFTGRRSIFNSLFIGIIVFNILPLILVIGAPRYRHYLLPIFIYFAASAIVIMGRKISEKSAKAL